MIKLLNIFEIKIYLGVFIMVILKRKQILLVIVFTFISAFAFMFTSAKKNTKEVIKQTVALPVTRKNNCIRCRAWSTR